MRHTFVREKEEERTTEPEREIERWPRDQEHDDKYFNLDGIWLSVPTPKHEPDHLCFTAQEVGIRVGLMVFAKHS